MVRLYSPYYFLLVSNSNHMFTSHRLAAIAAWNFFSYPLSLGWNFQQPPLPRGDFSQNLITSSLGQSEASPKNYVDWVNSFWVILLTDTDTHTDVHVRLCVCIPAIHPAQQSWRGLIIPVRATALDLVKVGVLDHKSRQKPDPLEWRNSPALFE